MPDHRDTWSSGNAYEPYVGRWSRLVALEFLRWLDAPESLRWLDVGCGTGALSEAIVARCSPDAVVGVDRSEEYLDYARARVTDPRVSFRRATRRRFRSGRRARHRRLRAHAQLLLGGSGARPGGDEARAPRRDGRGVRLGLRGRDAADAPLLGRRSRSIRPRWSSTRGGGFRSRAPGRWSSSSSRPGSRRCASSRSTFRRSSRTSTTTGSPFSAARPRRPDTACHSPKSGAPRSASGSGRR